MKIYKILFTLILTFYGLGVSYAQTAGGQYQILGTVTDSISGEVQPYATIRIKKAGNAKILKAVTSDDKGKYTLPLSQSGNYVVECILVGKQSWSKAFTIKAGEHKSTLNILLSDISNTLGTATVTAQRAVVKAEVDKIT